MRFYFILLILFFTISKTLKAQEIEHHHDIHYSFVENKGQWDSQILFQSKFNGGNLWIQQNKFLFHFQDYSLMHDAHAGGEVTHNSKIAQTVVHLNFIGSNKVNNIEKVNPTKNYYNYFLGNDSTKWASDVHGYSEAILKNLYDGIDLKLIENKKELKYEFHIQPNADPSKISLEYSGQKSLFTDKNGNLIVETELGRIIEKKPFTYQIINGKIVEITSAFSIVDQKVIFKLGKYNPNFELIIDPELIFATYSGSVTDNFGMTATYAHDGKAYSGGTIFGNQYPTPDLGAYDVSSNFTVPNNGNGAGYGITDVFISKYSADGTLMIWTSFFGGGNNNQGTETVHSLIADKNDNLYLMGATSSVNFPILNAYQSVHGGGIAGLNFTANGVYHLTKGTDIYVSKISSDGHNLLGSTYIGGSGNDGVNYNTHYFTDQSINFGYDSLMYNYGDNSRGEIMLDSLGNCLIATCTRSTDFPVLNAFQPNNAGKQDGVIFKLTANLSNLMWSSYIGGTNNDACYSVKIDSSANIVFSGGTSSIDLPFTSGAWKPTYNGGKADGFVGKLSPSGTTVTRISYIGTSNYDQAYFVEIDRNDNIFLLGQSVGGNFPVINSNYSNPNTCQFICKLNSTLTNVLNSTTFGNGANAINISPSAFMVDICGNIYLSGWGANVLQSNPILPMPITTNAYQTTTTGFDFYLLVLDRTFNSLIYSTYLGGDYAKEHVDGGTSRFDKNGVVYQSVCGGCGGFSDFPTFPNPGAHSNTNDSPNCNNVVFKFDFGIIPKAEFVPDQTIGCLDFTVVFNNSSTASDSYLWDFGNGVTSDHNFDTTITYNQVGEYQVYLYVTDSICQLTDTAHFTISVYDSLQLSVSNDTNFCVAMPLDLIANSFGTANYFVWSSSNDFTDTLNSTVLDSTLSFTPSYSGYYYVKVGNGGCFLIDSVKVEAINTYLTLSGNSQICILDTTHITVTNSNPAINFTFNWSPDSILLSPPSSSQATIYALSSQYIYLNVFDGVSCSFTDSIFIDVIKIYPNTIEASAADYYIPAGSSVQLLGKPDGLIYNWSPTIGLTNSYAQNPIATVNENTIYLLTAGFENCMKMDTVFIKVYPFSCDNPYVFVPDAFSPNGDNNNDILYVRGEMIKEMTFRVFNRWGQMVFESHETHLGWNGQYKGEKLDPDVYDYYLEVTCVDDQKNILKGNITLLK
ncbi:MAG: gliding motility-associated C-terminal domain-containing protein [Flavobacteriia bacterium]|nr:gliding motility-associated C-terminal domain-containing protein [Flavobacteriia bacterium]